MKKKFLTVLLAIIAALCLCFGLAACGEEPFVPTTPNTQTNQNDDAGGNKNPQQFTVIYDANGGSFAEGATFTQTVKEGAKLTAPISPTRRNYTFAGWAKNKSGSTMWEFDEDTVSESTTLYAQWTQESAVILSVEGASIEDREIFMLVDRSTGSISLSGKIVCSDDSIWRLYSDSEGQREIPTKMVTNLRDGANTYYIVVNSQNQAQVNVYELIVYRSFLVTVSYFDGENLLRTADAYTGNEFTANYRPNITGYTFNKWKTVRGEEFTSAVLWDALALYADKTVNTYKATLNVNGGDALTETEKTITYGMSYSLPVPRRTGYSFAGWYVGNTQITSANGNSLSAWEYASDQNVIAHWEVNYYAVTLRQNDNEAGSVSGGGDHAYDSQVTITATTNEGYNFLGWYDVSDELVSDETQYTFRMGFATTFTAKWDHYTLTTTRNDTSAGTLSKYYNEEKVSVGTKIILTAVTNTGYTFVGWYKGDERVSTDLSYEITMGRENVTYEARWEITHYALTFVYDEAVGDTQDIPSAYTIKDLPLTLPELIGKNGNKHISVGWTDEDGTEYADEIPQGTTGELTLTVIWGVAEGQHFNDGQNCGICGAICPYTRRDGKIYLGEYPQTEVKESGLKGMLGIEAGQNPTSDHAGKWMDYGYYINGSVQSYMWYIDVEYQENRYRGVYFTSYRGDQEDNGYNTNTVYWFKYEPIEWRILEENDGTAFLMATIILDSQQYYHDTGTRTIDGKTVYPNNYKESDIRAWLNETFYKTAFDGPAQAIVKTTEVDNSLSSMPYSSNPYACENTQDKVFLLSMKEVIIDAYRNSEWNINARNEEGQLKSTDYAKSQGAYVFTEKDDDLGSNAYLYGNGMWWLRSPIMNYSYETSGVYAEGNAYDSFNVTDANNGVVPALRIRL